MTMFAAQSRPGAVGRPQVPPRPRIRVLPAPSSRAAKAPFVAVVLILLIGGLGVLLMLNMLLAQGSFTVRDLTQKVATMQDREQALEHRVAALDAPQRLARRAASLGMVSVENPAFLRERDGRVLGVPVAAKGNAPAPVAVDDPKERRAEPVPIDEPTADNGGNSNNGNGNNDKGDPGVDKAQ